jgi:hypothetical protein
MKFAFDEIPLLIYIQLACAIGVVKLSKIVTQKQMTPIMPIKEQPQ